MLIDNDVAKEINDLLLDCRIKLSNSVDFVQEKCSNEESEQYKKAMGKVLGYMIFEIMEPIYEKHPELNPIDKDN